MRTKLLCLLATILLVLFSGCHVNAQDLSEAQAREIPAASGSSADGQADMDSAFKRNYDIPYVRYLYNRVNETFPEPLRNLTGTGEAISGISERYLSETGEVWSREKENPLLSYREQTLTPKDADPMSLPDKSFGTVILRSPEELEELLQRPEAEMEEVIRSADPPLPESSAESMRRYRLIWLEDLTKNLTFDSAFFAESDLLVVDLCCYSAHSLPARPEELTVKSGDIHVTVRYGYRNADTGDHFGTLILIPVPKGCQHVEATYEYMKNWK